MEVLKKLKETGGKLYGLLGIAFYSYKQLKVTFDMKKKVEKMIGFFSGFKLWKSKIPAVNWLFATIKITKN